MDKIDQDLYSRQIGTFGMEAMGKLIKMNVFIGGLRGLGVETAKNIILAGPKSVTLWDPTPVELIDLGSNFYLTEAHLGKRRDESCISKLKELNPYVTVTLADFDPTASVEQFKNYQVVVLTEIYETSFINSINEITRANSNGLVYSAATGVSGFVFVDFAKNFMVRDPNGEECKQYIVRTISKETPGVVLIDDTMGGKLAYEDGDYVSFKEVKGMTELNESPPRAIKYVSPIAFSIEDTSKYGDYVSGGIVEQVKVPKPHNFRSFAECLDTPYTKDSKQPDLTDFSKFGRNELLHIAVHALHEYRTKHQRLPETNNLTDANEVVAIAKELYNSKKEKEIHWIQNSQEFDEEVVSNVARWCKCAIVPITSFLGGIVAQEVVKFTGKYSPINQWLWFDFFESVANIKECDRTPYKSRYDDQVAIYGREIQEKLFKMNIFMIGAGALGCEFLKEFALMGIATKDDSKLTVTDNDNIEISNLNRQFLFRRDNVKQSKSLCAAQAVKAMNKDFQTNSMQSLVCPDNEHIFNDKFWEKQNFVINAVDNIKARKYIDNMCTWYNKPLIDSGTLGTKAHSQLIYPHVTSCYNDMQDPVEDTVPMCTLHNFPATIEHCIEWGRDQFNENFVSTLGDTSKYIEDQKSFLTDLKKEGNSTFQLNKLVNVKELIDISMTSSFDKCIDYAFNKFVLHFDHNIRQLLFNFPADYTNNDGSKFWTGSKRVPTPIIYKVEDKLCLSYVYTYATLVAQALGISVKDVDYVKNYSTKKPIPKFEPKKVYIKVKETDPDEPITTDDDSKIETTLVELDAVIKKNTNKDALCIKPHEFEKDDDTNHHIDQIHSSSNLRARNYEIVESERQKTKMIAGKIIPAIATTTASITGLVAIQIYTCLQTDKIDYMRGAFVNLGVNIYVLTEPGEKQQMKDKEYDPIMLGAVKAIPPNWSVWDKIEINESLTVQGVIDHYKKTYNSDVSIITCKGISLIQTFQPSYKNKLNIKIEDLYEQMSKTKISPDYNHLVLDISHDTEDGDIILSPLVKYRFR